MLSASGSLHYTRMGYREVNASYFRLKIEKAVDALTVTALWKWHYKNAHSPSETIGSLRTGKTAYNLILCDILINLFAVLKIIWYLEFAKQFVIRSSTNT